MKRFVVLITVLSMAFLLAQAAQAKDKAKDKDTNTSDTQKQEKIADPATTDKEASAEDISRPQRRDRTLRGEAGSWPGPGPGGRFPGMELPGEQTDATRIPQRGFEQQINMIEEQLNDRKRQHDAATEELKAILQIAKEEGAKKTAKHIDLLIEKREKAFLASIRKMQDRQEQIKKRLAQQMRQEDNSLTPGEDEMTEDQLIGPEGSDEEKPADQVYRRGKRRGEEPGGPDRGLQERPDRPGGRGTGPNKNRERSREREQQQQQQQQQEEKQQTQN